MFVQHKRKSMLLACIAGLTISFPAMAQQATDSGAQTGDIIVTARRVEERLQDVPISMTVLDSSQIANRNITIASDLATSTPALSVNQRYGPEKASFSLRGFNQDMSTAPTVGVYFADVVGLRAQGGTTSGNSVGAGAFMDLQNVQVLKGPQGTLFGRNTTGGAIMLVPKKPSDKLEGYVEGTYGNYNQRRVQAALNIPVNDTFKVRFAVDRNARDGYMHNLSGIGPDAYNDRDYIAARMSIVADLTPDLENYTIVQYSKSHTNGYGARIIGCDPTALTGTRGLTAQSACDQLARQTARGDSLYDVESDNPDPSIRLEQWQIINTTTWRASDHLTIKNIASYGEFREDSNFQINTSNFTVSSIYGPQGFNLTTVSPLLTTTGKVGGPPLYAAPGTHYQYVLLDTVPGGDTAPQSTATEELQLQGNAADHKLTYVIGGYLEFSRPLGFSTSRSGIFLNCTRPQDFACTNPLFFGNLSDSATQLSFDNNGVFAQATYNITQKLSFTGGIRYTFDKIAGFSQSTRVTLDPHDRNPASYIDPATGVRIVRTCNDTFRHGTAPVASATQCRTDLTNKSSAPTWLANVDYKFTPDLMVYAKYSRGYRQGGINFTNPGLELWQPEHLDSYEGGLKAAFHGAVSGYFDIAGFYNSLRDQQVFGSLISKVPGVAGGAAIINAGKSRSYGLEIDASATFFRSLRFDLGYAYLNTKVLAIDTSGIDLTNTPFSAVIPTVAPGSAFTLAPKNKVTFTGTYTLPLESSVGKISLGATFTYTSQQIANGAVPATLNGYPDGVLPAYSLLNLNLNWDNVAGTPIDLSLFATNVTDKAYPVNTVGSYPSTGFDELLMGEPRMYGVRVRYTFGG
jgi:iron complex outermembrane receptor protein